MPWDGALPMLRHGPLQLQVIAFPVCPPLLSFFPPPSSCPSPPVLFSGVRGSLLSVRGLAPLPLASSFPLSSSSLRWKLLYEMAVVQPRRRSLTALRACVPVSRGVRSRVREGEVDGENLSERASEREREGVLSQLWEFSERARKKPKIAPIRNPCCLQLSPPPSRLLCHHA